MKAGWLVALAYLFCVLAPAAALAWGNGPAPCFDEAQLADLAPVYHQAAVSHMHGSGAMHEHAGIHADHHAAAQDAPTHHDDGKGAAGPCCAMMCVSALPANLPDVAKPVQPISVCAQEIAVSLRSEAPPLLYRPPIA